MAESTTAPATPAPSGYGRPAAAGSPAAAHAAPPVKQQVVCFSFYKVMPEWRRLPAEERHRLMKEHIRIGMLYPRVKINTAYSFGIDDQEFTVAFETNYPEDFLALVEALRDTEISLYTLKDFPIFSCVRLKPMEMLDRLG